MLKSFVSIVIFFIAPTNGFCCGDVFLDVCGREDTENPCDFFIILLFTYFIYLPFLLFISNFLSFINLFTLNYIINLSLNIKLSYPSFCPLLDPSNEQSNTVSVFHHYHVQALVVSQSYYQLILIVTSRNDSVLNHIKVLYFSFIVVAPVLYDFEYCTHVVNFMLESLILWHYTSLTLLHQFKTVLNIISANFF